MSCAAAQAPGLAGAGSCCPSRADTVLRQAGTTSHILLLGSPYSLGSVVKPTRSSLLHQCFPWGLLCALGLVQPQYPAPAASLCFREKVNQEYRLIDLPSHLTLDKRIASSSCLHQQRHRAAPWQGHFQGKGAGICKTPVMIVYSCHF